MNLVVQLKQAFEDFAAGFGVDGEARAVVFGEVVNFVEVVAEVEVCPAVGLEDGVVHPGMEATEFLDASDGFVEGDGSRCAGKVLAKLVCGFPERCFQRLLLGFFLFFGSCHFEDNYADYIQRNQSTRNHALLKWKKSFVDDR